MKDKGPDQFPEIGIEKIGPLQGLDLAPVLTQTGIDLDALDVVNMIILQGNALTLSLMKNQAQIPLGKCYPKMELQPSMTLTLKT